MIWGVWTRGSDPPNFPRHAMSVFDSVKMSMGWNTTHIAQVSSGAFHERPHRLVKERSRQHLFLAQPIPDASEVAYQRLHLGPQGLAVEIVPIGEQRNQPLLDTSQLRPRRSNPRTLSQGRGLCHSSDAPQVLVLRHETPHRRGIATNSTQVTLNKAIGILYPRRPLCARKLRVPQVAAITTTTTRLQTFNGREQTIMRALQVVVL